MRVVVTGSEGFIGSHVVRTMRSAGIHVAGVDIRPGATYVADVRHRHEMTRIMEAEKPWMVVHLAALAGVRQSFDRRAEYESVNVSGTQSVVWAAQAAGASRFVFASSSSVYGSADRPSAEGDPLRPASPYAGTKADAERFLATISPVTGPKMSIRALRFFTVYGPGGRDDMAAMAFYRAICEGRELVIYGSGAALRDMTYVADVVRAIMMPRPPRPFEVMNVGTGRQVSVMDLIAKLERITGQRAKVRHDGPARGDVAGTWADTTRSMAMGWRALVDIDTGLRSMVASQDSDVGCRA